MLRCHFRTQLSTFWQCRNSYLHVILIQLFILSLQISLLSPVCLNLVRYNFQYFLFITPSYLQGSCQKDFEKPPSQSNSKDKSGNIASIGICFYVLKFSKKLLYTSFLLHSPLMCRTLYKSRFEPPARMSKEKSRNIVSRGIESSITKVSQKCFILSVYCTACVKNAFNYLLH